jgi:branched-chain amino acid transport system substrate-binding protein
MVCDKLDFLCSKTKKRREKMKRIFSKSITFSLIVVLLSWGVCAGEWKKGVVKIGTMAGMTGAFADVGQAQVMGVGDRIKYQNDELGGISGHEIEHLWADMKTDVPTAIRLYKRWAAMKPKPIEIAIGHSSAVHQLIKDFNKDEITSVTFNWNAPQIMPPGYLFWPIPGYADMVVAFGKWVKENWDYSKGMPTVAFLRWDHPCGVAIAEYGGGYCEKQGFFKVVIDEIVPIGAVDATSHLIKISKEKPNFVYTMLLGTTPIAIKQADKMGLLKDMQFVLRAYDTGNAYVNASGKLADGLLGVLPCARLTDTELPGVAKILEVHKKYHGESAKIEDDFSYIIGWLIGDITIAAAKMVVDKHGYENLSGKTVKNALESMKNYDTGGLTHPISFGEGTEGRRGNPYSRMARYNFEQKNWKPISEWYKVPFLTEEGASYE